MCVCVYQSKTKRNTHRVVKNKARQSKQRQVQQRLERQTEKVTRPCVEFSPSSSVLSKSLCFQRSGPEHDSRLKFRRTSWKRFLVERQKHFENSCWDVYTLKFSLPLRHYLSPSRTEGPTGLRHEYECLCIAEFVGRFSSSHCVNDRCINLQPVAWWNEQVNKTKKILFLSSHTPPICFWVWVLSLGYEMVILLLGHWPYMVFLWCNNLLTVQNSSTGLLKNIWCHCF